MLFIVENWQSDPLYGAKKLGIGYYGSNRFKVEIANVLGQRLAIKKAGRKPKM